MNFPENPNFPMTKESDIVIRIVEAHTQRLVRICLQSCWQGQLRTAWACMLEPGEPAGLLHAALRPLACTQPGLRRAEAEAIACANALKYMSVL